PWGGTAIVRSLLPKRRPRPIAKARLRLETLETRNLCAAVLGPVPPQVIAAAEPSDTLNLAQDLGSFDLLGQAVAQGRIGDGAAGPADVDWYRFSVQETAHVHLVAVNGSSSAFAPVVSLYNDDPFDFSDPFDPLSHRLLVQS